jgi:hypothetical protein
MSEFNKEDLIGLSLHEAYKKLEEGISIRVMRLDGDSCIGTCDLNMSRLNVSVSDGVIDEVFDFG